MSHAIFFALGVVCGLGLYRWLFPPSLPADFVEAIEDLDDAVKDVKDNQPLTKERQHARQPNRR